MHRNVVQFSSRKTNNSISTQMNETEKYDEKQIINKRKSFCTQNAKSTEYQIGNATQAQWGQIYLFLRAFAAIRSQTPAPPPPHLVVVVMQFYFVFIYFDFLLETNWKHSKTVRRVLCMFGQIAETNSLENNTKLRQQIEQFSVNLQ